MTDFTDIYDNALVVIKDYNLDNLSTRNPEAFMMFMKSLLQTGIPFFNCCLHSLEYEETNEEVTEDGVTKWVTHTYFVDNLTTKEKSILAMCIVYQWFKRDVNDASQFRQKLNTRDFKTESSYQSLQKRSEYLDKLREQIYQEILNYQIDNMDSIVDLYGGLA